MDKIIEKAKDEAYRGTIEPRLAIYIEWEKEFKKYGGDIALQFQKDHYEKEIKRLGLEIESLLNVKEECAEQHNKEKKVIQEQTEFFIKGLHLSYEKEKKEIYLDLITRLCLKDGIPCKYTKEHSCNVCIDIDKAFKEKE